MLDEPETSPSRRWRRSDVARAVLNLAQTLGWEVRPIAQIARPSCASGRLLHPSCAATSMLLLVRRHDRRLIFAELCSDGTSDGPRADRAFIDLVRNLAWDVASDERAQAVAALGHPVPAVETFVWRPRDLDNGSIYQVLR